MNCPKATWIPTLCALETYELKADRSAFILGRIQKAVVRDEKGMGRPASGNKWRAYCLVNEEMQWFELLSDAKQWVQKQATLEFGVMTESIPRK